MGEKMIRTIFKVDGMHCPMCESHVDAVVRKCVVNAKVNSSHKKGEIIVESEQTVDQEKIKTALADTGYIVLDSSEEVFEKPKSFFSRLFG